MMARISRRMSAAAFQESHRPFRGDSFIDVARACLLFNTFNMKGVVHSGQEVISNTENVLGKRLTGKMVKATIFKQFAGGVDAASAIGTIHTLGKRGVGGIPQYCVEQDLHSSPLNVTELEALIQLSVDKFTESIEIAASGITQTKRAKMSALKLTACCDPNILAVATDEINSIPEWFQPEEWKRSNKPSLSLSVEHQKQWSDLITRLEGIAQVASDLNVVVLIDAEQTYFQPAIRHLVVHHLMPKFNQNSPIIYNTVQCYLKGARETMEQELQTARLMGYYYGAKVVRGGYMDSERALAQAKGQEDPIQPTKAATDESYSSTIGVALTAAAQGYARIKVASHNPTSVRDSLRIMDEQGIPSNSGQVTFGQLYGMGNHITFPLGESGHHVYKIVPYGPVMEVVPYLLRRAQENSAGMVCADKERQLLNEELWKRMCFKK